MSITVENRVGRVVEIYIRERETDDAQIANVREMLKASVAAATRGDRRMVIVGDLRDIVVIGPKLAEFFVETMRRDNESMERSGLLTSSSATFNMQLDRVMRESAHPNRRRFEDPRTLLAWLREVLDEAEMKRAIAFLAASS